MAFIETCHMNVWPLKIQSAIRPLSVTGASTLVIAKLFLLSYDVSKVFHLCSNDLASISALIFQHMSYFICMRIRVNWMFFQAFFHVVNLSQVFN
jgi:hypothetical protein